MKSKSMIENEIKLLVENSLNVFRKYGVELSYFPTCEFIPNSKIGSFTALTVADEVSSSNDIYDSFLNKLGVIELREYFGLKFSDDAIIQASQMKIKNSDGVISHPTKKDIAVYSSFLDLDKNLKQTLVGHDVWHLIEKEHSILGKHLLIQEGTASLVGLRVIGSLPGLKPENANSIVELEYSGVAYMVQMHLNEYNADLPTILETDFRDEVEFYFYKRMNSYLTEIVRRERDNPKLLNQEMRIVNMSHDPFFKELKGNLSENSLLDAFRKYGAELFAQELANQPEGLTKYIADLKSLGL